MWGTGILKYSTQCNDINPILKWSRRSRGAGVCGLGSTPWPPTEGGHQLHNNIRSQLKQRSGRKTSPLFKPLHYFSSSTGTTQLHALSNNRTHPTSHTTAHFHLLGTIFPTMGYLTLNLTCHSRMLSSSVWLRPCGGAYEPE